MFSLKSGGVCPQCEFGKLKEEIKAINFKYKEKIKVFQQEKIFACDFCDYEGLDQDADKRIDKELTDFRRSVD